MRRLAATRALSLPILTTCSGCPASASSTCNTVIPVAERDVVERELGVKVVHLDDIDNTNDIDGLGALLSACDAVVTVSNTTAHLAGALGRPTWVFVPYGFGRMWYWFKDVKQSPWYPKAEVMPQGKDQSWGDLVSMAMPEIMQLLRGGS